MADQPIPELKTCTKCGETKPRGEFPSNRYRCHDCGKAYYKARHESNRDEILARRRVKYDPEINKAQCRAYYSKNRRALIESATKWRDENREARRAICRRYMKRLLSTPRGRVDANMSRAISAALRGTKDRRSWPFLVDYSLDDLVAHLERQFTDGMSWANYGEWHIDHIIPKAAFNYETPDHIDFKRCWALSNLQPLWAIDNQSKGAKLSKPFQPSLAI